MLKLNVVNEWAVNFVAFTSFSPIFKGFGTLLVGLLALGFAWWMKKRWQEPVHGALTVFIAISLFVTLFGLFVLIFQPNWWALPY